jgi:hypothetical protein
VAIERDVQLFQRLTKFAITCDRSLALGRNLSNSEPIDGWCDDGAAREGNPPGLSRGGPEYLCAVLREPDLFCDDVSLAHSNIVALGDEGRSWSPGRHIKTGHDGHLETALRERALRTRSF